MDKLDPYLSQVYLFIQQYNKILFILATLSLIFLFVAYYKKINSTRYIINRILKLLNRKPGKAFKTIIKSDLEIIDYLLTPGNISSGRYLEIKQFLSEGEQVKKIFSKYSGEDDQTDIERKISIFAKLATPQAVDYLITYLYEKEPEIVHTAINHLSNIDSDKVVDTFIEFLKCVPDAKTLSYLEKAFLKFGPEAAHRLVPHLVRNDLTIKIWVINILGHFPGEDFAPVIIEQLKLDNPELKISCIKNLAYFDDPQIVPEITACLNDPNWGVRSQAANKLGELQATESAENLYEKLNDKSGIVRDAAANALVNLGYKGIKYLLDVAKDPAAPEEIVNILKNMNLSFLIESMEKIYQDTGEEYSFQPELISSRSS